MSTNKVVEQKNKKEEGALKKIASVETEAKELYVLIKKCVGVSLSLTTQIKQKIDDIARSKKEQEEQKQKEQEVLEKAKAEQEKALKQAVPERQQPTARPTNAETRPVRDNFQRATDTRRPNQFVGRTNGYNNNGFGGNRTNGGENIRTRHFENGATGNGYQNREQRPYNGNRFNNFAQGTQNSFKPRPAGVFGAARPAASAGSSQPAYQIQVKTNTKQQNKKKGSEHSYEEKKSLNKKALVMKGFVADESLENEDGVIMGSRKIKKSKNKQEAAVVAPKIEHAVITTDNLTVKILAEKIGKPAVEIIKKFMILGNMVNINSTIDYDSAELIASEFGVTLEKKLEKTYEEKLSDIYKIEDDEKNLVKRPPVVCVLGHVDHGKTSLLDYIRETNVIDGEAGGITQHIGAYTIEKNNELITFIDTPGHAAFTAMRERGAKLTDIAILVVAADDGVMPQTIEAINDIQQVKAPMIVAINKIDKPEANIDRIKQQLTEHGVVPEEWGGDAIIIPISAKTGQNVDKLLEMILFVAEYQNLRANPNRKAMGSVIEAKLDKGMGPVATVLIQNGTLKVGDVIIAGTSVGKVRAMLNEKGKNVRSAGPSFAVSVLGLSSVPNSGDEVFAVDEKMGKKVLSERMVKQKTDMIKSADNSVDALMDRFKETEYKSYNIIIKADVQGSLEALTNTLGALMNEEVKVRCIHGGVGAINENDVMLASASDATIIAFNVKADFQAKVLSEKYKVNIQHYRIIYEAVDYVTKQINALMTPKFKEVVSGRAEIRVIFKASKVGAIAGSYILDGKLTKGQQVRLLRKNKEVYNGTIATIQREKNEVKDISAGFECGIVLNNFAQIEVGDIIEGINKERIN